MKKWAIVLPILLVLAGATPWAGETEKSKAKSIHEFTVKNIDGKKVDLKKYKDKVLLIVNVASKCGYTPQYEDLVKLHDKYEEKGFAVLGFPANEFGKQEPGTNQEIKTFCKTKYDVQFPMFSKVVVKGDDQVPLFHYLTTAKNPDIEGPIKWNFEKFLIGKNGKLLHRYRSKVEPLSEELTQDIQKALKS
jgi:glutathione peroxidase